MANSIRVFVQRLLKKLAFCLTAVLGFGGLTLACRFLQLPAAETPAVKGLTFAQVPQMMHQPPAAPRLDRNGDPLPPGAITRIGSARFRHTGFVTTLLYTPDGKRLISFDGSLRLWDAATGKLLWRVEWDMGPPLLAISDDGKRIAALSRTEFVVVMTESGNVHVRHRLPSLQDQAAVLSMAISPDLGTFALGCFDGTVRLLDADSAKEKLRFLAGAKDKEPIPFGIRFSEDGKKVLVIRGLDGAPQSSIPVFSTTDGRFLQLLEPKTGKLLAQKTIFSRDVRLLATITGDDPETRDPVVVFWDVATGKACQAQLHSFFGGMPRALSPDNSLFAIGSQGKEIVLLKTSTGKEHRRFDVHGFTTALAFTPDGKTLAAASQHGFTLWDVASGKVVPPSPEPNGPIWSLRFLAGGKQLLAIADGIYWWDVMSGKLLHHLPEAPAWYGEYGGASITNDGKLLAESLLNGDMVLVDTASGRTLRTFIGHKSVVCGSVFSADGTKLFTAGGWDKSVIIWEVATGKLLQKIDGQLNFLNRLALSSDGRWLAYWSSNDANGDYNVRIWDVANAKLAHHFEPRQGPVNVAAFSADSARLVFIGGKSNHQGSAYYVQLWDVVSGKEIRTFTSPEKQFTSVSLTSDGRILATGIPEKSLGLWEVVSGKERSRIAGHQSAVYRLDFSPDGKLLAAASNDAPIFIWDVYGLAKPNSAPANPHQVHRAPADLERFMARPEALLRTVLLDPGLLFLKKS
jgi:WD40 repeat protein